METTAMMKLGLNRIQIIVSLIFVGVVILYSLWAFWGYVGGSDLTITFPYDGYSTTSPLIMVTGIAKDAQFISLNDRPNYIDEQAFVRDRFGREQSSLMYVLRTE